MLWLSIPVSWLILVFHCLQWRVWSHPSMGSEGPSSGGWEYSCIREVDRHCHSSWHKGYLPISLPPCLALPTMTQFGEWLHSSWGSLSASINGHWCHSLHCMYVLLLRFAATSHYLRSSPIFCGCSRGCPWQKLELPVYPPQGSFAGRSLGDCLTIILLWHQLHFTSYRGSLAWGGAGTPVPCMMDAPIHKGMPTSDATRRSWFWCSMHDFPCWFITSVRGDAGHDLMHHLPSILFPPILDLPLSLKSICLH